MSEVEASAPRANVAIAAPYYLLRARSLLSGLTWQRFAVFCLVLALYKINTLVDYVLTGAVSPRPALRLFWYYVWLYRDAFVCFFPVLVAVVVALNLASQEPWKQAIVVVLAVTAGIAVGTGLKIAVDQVIDPAWHTRPYNSELGIAARRWYFALIVSAMFFFANRESQVQAELHSAGVRRSELARQSTETQLQRLQAQIEPHFLFNTLATIRRLQTVNRARGMAMLRYFVAYLRTALPSMREQAPTLGRELAYVEAFLNVQKIRMGDRLRYQIEASPDLMNAVIPPMMLVTLVENAIKHGLAPQRRGGTVRILAFESAGRLLLAVDDDGRGLTSESGTGVGLENIRMRLDTMFGPDAAMSLQQRATGGVSAILEMPLRMAT